MTRTATGATLDILDALEPQAKAGWEEELLNLREAIELSRAITARRLADNEASNLLAAVDANTITIKQLDPATQDLLPADVRDRNDPDWNAP